MKKVLYFAAGALIAGFAVAAPASAAPAPQSQQAGVTQDLSARCRVVVSRTWRHGHRVTVRRTVCRRHWY